MQKIRELIKNGDTIIEVTFAISVFALISVISLQIMDRDIAIIQATLESEMARNEIDAQAEALRYIQNAYLSERELARSHRSYQDIWLKLSRGYNSNISTAAGAGLANEPSEISQYSSVACSTFYDKSNSSKDIHNIFADHAFVINTRSINPTSSEIKNSIIQSANPSDANKFVEAQLYPRIIFTKDGTTDTTETTSMAELFPSGGADNATNIMQNTPVYNKVSRVEGIWVIAAKATTKGSSKTPEFYDFHIRTCWFAPGHDRPSTIATTIRLYNPEYIEEQK